MTGAGRRSPSKKLRSAVSRSVSTGVTAEKISDPRARLEAIGRAYVRFGMKHPETYRLVFMEDPQLTTAVFKAAGDDPGQRAYRALIEPFEQLRDAGRLRSGAFAGSGGRRLPECQELSC